MDSTQQAAQFVGSKAAGTVKGSAQKAKMAIQKRQKLIKERKAQAAEEKARSEGAGQREPETGGDGMRYGIQEQPVLADNMPAYHNGMQARAGIEAGPAPPFRNTAGNIRRAGSSAACLCGNGCQKN